MHSRKSGALLFCACSVPAVLLLPKLHPAAVVLSAAAAVGLFMLMQDGADLAENRCLSFAASFLLVLLLGRAAQFTGISYPTAEHTLWMDLLLLALAVYASKGGLDRILRVCAICFFFLIVIYLLIAVFSLKNINVIYPTGVVRPEIGYTSLIWVFLPVLFCTHRAIRVRQRRGIWAALLFALWILPTILVWISQSRDFASCEKVPFYAMVKTIRAFRIVERFEPVLSAALTAGNFCLMSALCVLLREHLQKIVPDCGERAGTVVIFLISALICTMKYPLPDILIVLVAPIVCAITALINLCGKKLKKS